MFRRTKRTYGKKRRGLRRRTNRRPNRIYRPMRRVNPIHYYTRYSFYQAPLVSMTMDANGQKFGNIHSQGITQIYTDLATVAMPGLTDFTSLYDEYKVLSYTVEIRPRFTSQDLAWAGGTSGNYIPTIYWVYDTDDINAPTSMGAVMEHPKVRSAQLNKIVYLTVKYPTVRTAIYQPGVSFAYSTNRCPWLDLTNASVPLLGIKYAIQGKQTFDYTAFFDIRVKWRVAFKNPR